MQQTRFDRWLKERLTRETHVFSLSEPPWVPPGVELEPLQTGVRNRYRYRMIIRGRRSIDRTLAILQQENQTFATKVHRRRAWYAGLIDDPHGASLTLRLIWLVLLVIAAILLVSFFPRDLPARVWESLLYLKQFAR